MLQQNISFFPYGLVADQRHYDNNHQGGEEDQLGLDTKEIIFY